MIKSMKVLGVLFTVACCFAFVLETEKAEISSVIRTSEFQQPSLKEKALVVLKNKCNKCHLKENRSVIFNEFTMMHKAKKINKMVFIKKKMPKDDVTLTDAERKTLRAWLDSIGETL